MVASNPSDSPSKSKLAKKEKTKMPGLPQGSDPSLRQVFSDLGGGDRGRKVAHDNADAATSAARNAQRIADSAQMQRDAASRETAAIRRNKP
jgi:hypothetical protein